VTGTRLFGLADWVWVVLVTGHFGLGTLR